MGIDDRVLNYKNMGEALKYATETGKGITFINSSSNDVFISYEQLYERALYLLYHLQEKGIKPQDELIFQIDNELDFITAFWACILGKIIPVPVTIGSNNEHKLKMFKIWQVLNNPYLLATEETTKRIVSYQDENNEFGNTINEIIGKSIIIDNCICQGEKGRLQKLDFDDIAFIQFSSGSTGDPKGVVLTHRNLLTNIRGIIKGARLTDSDSTFSWVPLTHDLGLIGFHLTPLVTGINQYIMPTTSYIRNPMLWLKKSSYYRASVLTSPNFGYKHFINFYKPDKVTDWDLSCVRLIFNGAEPISPDLSNEFYQILSRWGLKSRAAFPVYGLAEASLGVTFPPLYEGLQSILVDRNSLGIDCTIKELQEIKEESVSFVDLGFPIAGCDIRICNEENEVLSERTVGFVHIRGDNVTAGYYNNKKATEAVRTQDGWLNTGDLGFISKGRLVITGRAKDIIFINGQNYYPHDIERVAEGVDGIDLGKIAVCGIFNEKTQREEITAFIIHRGSLEKFIPLVEALKKYINSQTGLEVGEVIPIRRIPKTTSGKVQRYKLKEEYEKGIYKDIQQELKSMLQKRNEERMVIKPANEIEKKLVSIWSEVLQIKNIGVCDNFFELGGNSLKATYIAAKIQKELNINIPLKKLFEITNIRKLAESLSLEERKEYKPIGKALEKENYNLSSQQKMIYVLSKLDENSVNYHIVQALRIEGKLDKDKLNNACNKVLKMNESLRTYFTEIDGEHVQKICNNADFTIDFRKAEEQDINKIINDFIQPFDFKKAPLFRMMLINTEEDSHILVMNLHHIIFDGSSVAILIKDIFNIYNGNENIEERIQYKDYSEWQNSMEASNIIKKQEAFWIKELEGELATLNLPEDMKRPLVQSFEGDRIYLELDSRLSSRIKELAIQRGSTLYIVLLTAYYILLTKYSQQDDIIVGSPVLGRTHPDLENVIGMFVNTLALRNYPKANKSFVDFLIEVGNRVLTSFDNQDYPFERLFKSLEITRDMSRNPLFDTMFVLQNMDISKIKADGLKIEKYPFSVRASKFDLTVFAEETFNGILFEFEYCTNIFEKETIETMGQHYFNILKEIVDNPKVKIADITMLSSDEKQKLIFEHNNTQLEYPKDKTLQRLFEEQAERTPNNIALIYNNNTMTYRELNQKSNQLANYLRSKGVKRDSIVGILMDRSAKLMVAILAVLKAGGAYLPIDLSYPKDRIEYMLEDSKSALLLVDSDVYKELKYEGIVIDINNKDLLKGDDKNLKCINTPSDLAYLIYTSGSTGKPKGTMLEHQSVINYVWWAAKKYVQDEKLNFPLYTTISFDLTVTSIYIPLITGNSIVIYDEDDKQLLIEKIFKEDNVGVVKLTPAHLRVIKDRDNSSLGIKRLIVGGEQLETKIAKEVYESFGGRIEIYNEYGPTETAVGCMIYRYDHNNDDRLAVPIGIPADNVKIYVLDKHLKPVPANTVGEIYISGDGVARGYFGKEELTAEKFIPNPFIPGMRMYKTGDLAKRLKNGNIEFIGRNDEQVKIRGYRIETGEIEKRLLEHAEINEILVLSKEDRDGNKYLCGYYVSDKMLKVEELRRFIIEELPEYMVPSYFVMIDEVPLTSNGKIDKKALPDPMENIVVDREYVEPTDEVEKIIASVWENVLGVEKVGITDNYYSLGGDSIKAIQIVSKVNEKGIDIKVKDILTCQTISELTNQIKWCSNEKIYEQGLLEGSTDLIPIHRWFFSHDFKNVNYYNQTAVLELKKAADVEKLNSAFEVLLRQHDALRLNYNSAENTLFYNNIHIEDAFKIEYFDLSMFTNTEQAQEIEKIGNTVKGNFDIYKELLIKVALIDRGVKPQLLMITVHHLAIDGVSWRILLEDLFSIIDSLEKEQERALSPKTASMKDWYEALMKYSNSPELNDQIEYWKTVEETDFDLPRDFDTSDWSIGSMKKNKFRLDVNYTAALLIDANKAYNTLTQELLITVLAKVLTTWTGKSIIKLDLEGHGRFLEDVNVSRTIGWFTSIYPVKLILSENNLDGQIKEVKEQLRKIPDSGNGYPVLKYMKGCFKDEADIAPVRFNYLGTFDNTYNSKRYSYFNNNSGNDISCENNITAEIDIDCMVVNGMLEFELKYNSNAYKEKTISLLQDLILENLKSVIDYTTGIEEIYFTPSDFDTVAVSQSDLDSLFE